MKEGGPSLNVETLKQSRLINSFRVLSETK